MFELMMGLSFGPFPFSFTVERKFFGCSVHPRDFDPADMIGIFTSHESAQIHGSRKIKAKEAMNCARVGLMRPESCCML